MESDWPQASKELGAGLGGRHGAELLKLWHPVPWNRWPGVPTASVWPQLRGTADHGLGCHTGNETLSLRGHRGRINSVAWSPDGARLVSAGDDGTVKIWGFTPQTGRLGDRSGPRQRLAWSPKGDRLASADGGKVKIWNPGRERKSGR